jgi:hypothetical protein
MFLSRYEAMLQVILTDKLLSFCNQTPPKYVSKLTACLMSRMAHLNLNVVTRVASPHEEYTCNHVVYYILLIAQTSVKTPDARFSLRILLNAKNETFLVEPGDQAKCLGRKL